MSRRIAGADYAQGERETHECSSNFKTIAGHPMNYLRTFFFTITFLRVLFPTRLTQRVLKKHEMVILFFIFCRSSRFTWILCWPKKFSVCSLKAKESSESFKTLIEGFVTICVGSVCYFYLVYCYYIKCICIQSNREYRLDVK